MNLHGIKAATSLTGLSGHVIRVWEKRYNAVTPQRTETNRRLYSDEDILRLQNLSQLLSKGYAIGQIAQLTDVELKALWDSIEVAEMKNSPAESHEQSGLLVQAAAAAIRNYDQDALNKIFDDASLALGYSGLLELVVIPLIQQVGDDWHRGLLTCAGEHAATSFIKDYLAHSVRTFSREENAPVLVVTTPAGQLHELGAFIGSCQARKSGWKIIYLGPSLPADEIARTASRVNAAAILLSIVYPLDDPDIEFELKRLRRQAPPQIPILVGGTGVKTYHQVLAEIAAISMTSFSDLAPELLKIRESRLTSSV